MGEEKMKFFSKYKYGLLAGLILTLLFSTYMALDWRDQISCIGSCNWDRLEQKKGEVMLEMFFSFFLILILPLILISLLVNYGILKIRNRKNE